MATAADDPRDALRSNVTAVRLLVDGWHDGVVDPRPGTRDGEQLQLHVRALSDLVERMTPVTDRAPRRR